MCRKRGLWEKGVDTKGLVLRQVNLSKLTVTLSKLGEGGIQDSQVFTIFLQLKGIGFIESGDLLREHECRHLKNKILVLITTKLPS